MLAVALACLVLVLRGLTISSGLDAPARAAVAAVAGFLLATCIGLVIYVRHAPSRAASDTPRLPVPPSEQLAKAQGAALTERGLIAPATMAQPAVEGPAALRRATSHFDHDALVSSLTSTDDPIALLKLMVGQIRTREGQIERDEAGTDVEAPCGLELFFARSLEEAGLFSDDVELPPTKVVVPHRSNLFYLRTEGMELPYLAKLRIIQIEAALNRVHFACTVLPDPDSITMEQAFVINARLASSICAQLPKAGNDKTGTGEWAVRQAIAVGIETLQMPFRLSVDYRVNMASGDVATSIELMPAGVFPASAYSETLGRVIPTTSEMRTRAATDYALRCGLLVAGHVFLCSPDIRHVCVAGVLDTPRTHSCLYSVDFDRERFESLDLGSVADPVAVYEGFQATMDHRDGALEPVTQSFSLEDERFCPALRYEPVDLSDRAITGDASRALGARHVRDLAIHEEARRESIADDMVRGLGASTEKNVRLILDLAGTDKDDDVRTAARRTVSKLIDGSLPEDNPVDVVEDFVAGDELTRSVEHAAGLLDSKRPREAAGAIEPRLDAIDRAGTYTDSPEVCWRSFHSYAGRALFNRMYPDQAARVRLVPDAYFDAHLLLSTAMLLCERPDRAYSHAMRCIELDPLDGRGFLRLARIHENNEDYASAIDDLKSLLRVAHDPEAVGVGYYRLAFMEWKSGNLLCARACYQRCMQFSSSMAAMAMVELRTLDLSSSEGADDLSSDEDVIGVLEAHDIPVAPTHQITDALTECAQAALDAEVFPVARNFTMLLGAFSGDDVVVDIMRSIEGEPDR